MADDDMAPATGADNTDQTGQSGSGQPADQRAGKQQAEGKQTEPDEPADGQPDGQGSDKQGKDNSEVSQLRAALSKANKDAERQRKQLKQYEDRDKTELQRAQETAQASEARVAEAEAKLTRYEVAAEKGLDADLAGFLPSGSREDMETAADRLLEKIAARAEPRKPKPDPSQGSQDRQGGESSMNTLMKAALGR